MAGPIVVEDEEFLGRARIYHRFHISGLHRPGGETNLSAVQKALPLITREQEREFVDQLISQRDDDLDLLRQDRVRAVATQEAAELESSLSLSNSQRFLGFDEYIARHEDHAKLVVRLFHTDIANPKQVHQFRAFHIQDSMPSIFLFNSPGSLVDSFLRRLGSVHSDLDILYPQLDLKRLADEGNSQIRGASFSIRNRPNLKTAIVFGPDVNEDDAWHEYSRVGELTYVQIQLVFETSEVKMMVTRRGSLLPYGIDDINEELRLCREVYDKYLKPYETGEVRLLKRKKR